MGDLDLQILFAQLSSVLSTYGLKVIGAILVLIIGRALAGLARRATRRTLERSNVDATLIPFGTGLVYTLAMVFVVVAVLMFNFMGDGLRDAADPYTT